MTKDHFPAIPRGASGPPGPEYNTSDDQDSRAPPGGYLGENQKGGGKHKDKKDKNNNDCDNGPKHYVGPQGSQWAYDDDVSAPGYIPRGSGNGQNQGSQGQGSGYYDNGQNQGWQGLGQGFANGYNQGSQGSSFDYYGNGQNQGWQGPDPNEPNYSADRWEAIHYAARNGNNNPSDLRDKIRCGDVNARGTTTEWTPLHVAVKFNQAEAVRQLLAAGAKVDLQDILGQTPLSLACCFNIGTEIPTLLINGGAYVNQYDKYTWTPLFWASSKGFYDVVDYLIRHGANKYALDKRQQRPWVVTSDNRIRSLLDVR